MAATSRSLGAVVLLQRMSRLRCPPEIISKAQITSAHGMACLVHLFILFKATFCLKDCGENSFVSARTVRTCQGDCCPKARGNVHSPTRTRTFLLSPHVSTLMPAIAAARRMTKTNFLDILQDEDHCTTGLQSKRKNTPWASTAANTLQRKLFKDEKRQKSAAAKKVNVARCGDL